MNHKMQNKMRILFEVFLSYILFGVLGFISRIFPIVFVLFVLYGILFPLYWGKKNNELNTYGYTWKNFFKSVFIGFAVGVFWCLYTFLLFNNTDTFAQLWMVQVLIGFFVWFLFLSPFQEFYFRGFFQSRLRKVFGGNFAILITSIAFLIWHFFPNLSDSNTSSLPLDSVKGILSIFFSSTLFGYSFEKSGNILAPWLAHAIGGLGLVIIGHMSFIIYS